MTTTTITSVTMPLENRSRTTVNKPLTPALSSNLRARPTFAPRLAGAGPTSPVASTSANPHRSLRQQTLSPERNQEERTISLNSNITPRSGARASRVDTDSPSTPDASARVRTLANNNQEDVSTNNQINGLTSPLPTPTHARPRSSDSSSMLPTARRVSGGTTISQSKEDTKFFRADDVRNVAVTPKNTTSRPRSAYFASVKSPRVSPKKASPEATDRLDDKFVYASTISTQNNTRPKTLLANKLSASSTRSLPIQSTSHPQASVRSPNQVSGTKAAPSTFGPPARQRSLSNTPSVPSSLERRRSSSLNIKPTIGDNDKGHRKSLSTNSASITPLKVDTSPEPIKAPRSAHVYSKSISSSIPPKSPEISSARSTSITSTLTSNVSAPKEASKPEMQPVVRPPLHPRHTRGSSETIQLQPITQAQIEAAANARRERKVLDLEISNSSLLAINRTLEKELRKQNAELRRFRRLSRSGRLSLTPSHRIVSGASMLTLTTLDEDDHDSIAEVTHSPTSSDGGSLEDDEDISNDDENDSSFTESSDVLRRRARDEKRLMQDLQRHQQILLDSQKLTQSIQRCLNCTDELIKDGKKALAYHVEANEIQIGGRVLSHDDDEALSEVDFSEYTQTMTQPRQGLLSPTVAFDETTEAAMWARATQDPSSEAGGLGSPAQFFPQDSNESLSPMLSPIILPER